MLRVKALVSLRLVVCLLQLIRSRALVSFDQPHLMIRKFRYQPFETCIGMKLLQKSNLKWTTQLTARPGLDPVIEWRRSFSCDLSCRASLIMWSNPCRKCDCKFCPQRVKFVCTVNILVFRFRNFNNSLQTRFFVDFCKYDRLLSSGTLIKHRTCYKIVWILAGQGMTSNQIIAISSRGDLIWTLKASTICWSHIPLLRNCGCVFSQGQKMTMS